MERTDTTTGGERPARPSGRPRWLLPIIAVLALLGVAGPSALVLISDDDPSTEQIAIPDLGRGADPGASELASLLARGRQRTYHATYAVTAGDQRHTIEWWSDGSRVRQDTLVQGDKAVTRTAAFRLGADKGAVTCRQDGNKPWTCEKIAGTSAGDPSAFLAGLQAQLVGRGIAVRGDQVAGRDARCFAASATPASEAAELCSDLDGIPLRLATTEATMELTALDFAIPKGTFDPPAKF